MKELIDFSEFLEIEKKLEIRMGLITAVERINKKMLKLSVNLGEEQPRTVVTNIGGKLNNPPMLTEQDLVGHQFPFITNLKPAVISGFESTAMIMVVEVDGQIEFPSYEGTPRFTPGAKLL
jgi:tRNA-binding EMAP/Myf-like protein